MALAGMETPGRSAAADVSALQSIAPITPRDVEKSSEPIEVIGPEVPDESTYLVSFHGDDDKDDPKNWTRGYKWLLIFVLAGMTLSSNINVLVCGPAIPAILTEFHQPLDSPDATLIVSIWNLGATLACLILGPLSELYGRFSVYNTSNLLCLLVLIVETQSINMGMVLAFRCLNGLTMASMALNSGLVGDIFRVEERGRAQSLLALMPLLGPVVGPIAGGWLAQRKGWRWTFWFTFIILAVFSLAFLVLYRESYEGQILRRKASKLRKETGDGRWHSKYDHRSSARTLTRAFTRPLRIFVVPIFLMAVLPGSIVTGYTYLVAASITTVYETTYGFSEGGAGLVYLGIAIGMALSSIFCSLILDPYTKRMKARHDGQIKPEWRLPPVLIGFVATPLGLFLYGWTAQYQVQYVVPIIGTALIGFGSYVIIIPNTTYLADSFGAYRASATAALSMTRNALSTVLPLAGPALYNAVGLGWGNSVLAFIALALLPIPLMLMWRGERIRGASKLELWD